MGLYDFVVFACYVSVRGFYASGGAVYDCLARLSALTMCVYDVLCVTMTACLGLSTCCYVILMFSYVCQWLRYVFVFCKPCQVCSPMFLCVSTIVLGAALRVRVCFYEFASVFGSNTLCVAMSCCCLCSVFQCWFI